MTKRQRFIAITLVLLLLFTNLLRTPTAHSSSWWFMLPISALGLSFLALKEELVGVSYFTALFLPTTFTIVFALIFRLFVFSPIFRYVLLGLYGLGFYVSLLCSNILGISSIKIIPLHRAARTIGLLITFFTSFLGFTVLYKFKLPIWLQVLLVFVYATLACWQYLWTIEFGKRLEGKVVKAGLLVSGLTAEVAFALSFIPLRVFVRALLVTVPIYFGLGLLTQYFQKRFLYRHIFEYAAVIGIAVLLTILVL